MGGLYFFYYLEILVLIGLELVSYDLLTAGIYG